ncbi:hypothetical protein NDI48_31215 [Microcoleus sp. AS-A8]
MLQLQVNVTSAISLTAFFACLGRWVGLGEAVADAMVAFGGSPKASQIYTEVRQFALK